MALPLLRNTPMPDDFTFDEALEVARQILAWLEDDPPACEAMRLGFVTYAVLEVLRPAAHPSPTLFLAAQPLAVSSAIEDKSSLD
jgi:hypothetical protein